MTHTSVVPGRFISFEGGEGAGKSTQIKRLAAYLESKGLSVVVTREPGGTVGSEQVRRILKDGEPGMWDGMSEILLFYAARRDLVEKVIKPALSKGAWVLADRFADSSVVYQGVGRGLGIDRVLALHQLVLGDFWPDLTFLLDLVPEDGFARVESREQALLEKGRQKDRFEAMGLGFHQKIYDAYHARVAGDKRFIVVDAMGTPDAIHGEIAHYVAQRFPACS